MGPFSLSNIVSLIESIRSLFKRDSRNTPESARVFDARRGLQLDKTLVLRLPRKKIPTAKQFKHLSRYLSPREMAVIKILGAVIVIGLLVAGAKYTKDHGAIVPGHGGDYTEAVVGAPHLINPVLTISNDADVDLVRLVYSGLVKLDAKGAIVPDLARKYTVSPDGLTYTFALREDVVWHDGQPFTSQDVVTTFADIENPSWKSPYAGRFKNIQVTAPDDHSVVFTLAQPFAPFLSMLTIGIIPDHLWRGISPENAIRAELNLKPIGTGPFKFLRFSKDKRGAILSYTVQRNEQYYDDAPYLHTITFKFYEDFNSATDALIGKKTEGISYLPTELKDRVGSLPNVSLYTFRLPEYSAVFFNTDRNSALQSKNVRVALAMAIDKQKIVSDVFGDATSVVDSPVLNGMLGYDPSIKGVGFDAVKASQLLDAEGWLRADPDGMRQMAAPKKKRGAAAAPTPLTVTLTTVDTGENVAIAHAIKSSWDALGVKTMLDIVPAAHAQQDVIRPRAYEALLYGEIVGADSDPYAFWDSSQVGENGLNLANFSNKQVDTLLEKARATIDQNARIGYYKEFQTTLLAETPAVFLYSPGYTYVVSKNMKGIQDTAGSFLYSPADRFSSVTKWYMKTTFGWQ